MPRARSANCQCTRFHTCRACFEQIGPTPGNLPTFTVQSIESPIRVQSWSQVTAESAIRHRTRNGKVDRTFLNSAK